MENKQTIVVIGGVAAGASAAAKARREDERATILVYEKGKYVSFANCGLPYYVGNEIMQERALLLHTPDSLKTRFNLDVFVEHEVLEIKPEEHQVVVKNLQAGETFTQSYDKVILATGTKPIVPNIDGIHSRNVHLLRTVPDAVQIKQQIEAGNVKKAVVVGGGFIGLEAVENLHRQGVSVTLIEKADQVMTPFDREMVVDLEDMLQKLRVEVILNNGITKFVAQGDRAEAVQLEDGTVIHADMFLLSIGVRPDVTLAEKAGIELGATRAIAVNGRMETSIPDIYAAGDAVEIHHRVSGKSAWIPLAGPANKQGRVAGANAVGRSMEFKGAYGTSIVRVGNVVAAKTGLSEKECIREGMDYRVTYNYHGNHAAYYPGSEGMMIKLIAEQQTGRILGAQIVGGAGVDKRIDVLATAIYGHMTVEDLEHLDLAYAPPFGAAKDPIIMAGMTHANLYRAEGNAYTPAQVAEQMEKKDIQIVDVRNEDEWAVGMIPGAIGIPLPMLRARLNELDPAKETVVYCRSGQRSYFASRILMQNGFQNLKNLMGGYLGWTLFQKSLKES
ncbi:FAD-dependent oxidoreductase [Fodinisporobacter ferrooxydans]|uniref:FAD-dependent oxidoreductase n=1 Tax=Fodinisporobacter ferrooxydans TaxID=2901836 RepID=A0ABY4CNN9_9BACL|nr:FAD-dependent oxidoreductase [Alicyclobacillaceae bacterium MYW30-H2]